MASKYLKRGSDGFPEEQDAITTSAGATDAGKIPGLDSAGRWDNSFMPAGLGLKTKTMTAFEALAAGDFVNVFSDSGTLKARKADGANRAKAAMGYVQSAVSAAATATVYYDNEILTGLSGLTIGTRYFLSQVTPGAINTTAPASTTAGHIIQCVGVALSATELLVQIERTPIVVAA